MTDRQPRNVAASVRQRLQNLARGSKRPFQELLQYYAMERFLYRLSHSAHADRFILKGALVLQTWLTSPTRSTRDIDLLGRMTNEVDIVAAAIRDACVQEVEPDGLLFPPESVAGRSIKEDANYAGVRLKFLGMLHNIRLPMQIDVGFGDAVWPAPAFTDYPTLLGHDPPRLRAYPREAVIAEKFEAMVKLGLPNSRMKDFYDVFQLSRQLDFDGPVLSQAIAQTFAHRGTAMTAQPTALSREFATEAAKNSQWRALLNTSRLEDAPVELSQVIQALSEFLVPVATALSAGTPFVEVWRPPGPWQTTSS